MFKIEPVNYYYYYFIDLTGSGEPRYKIKREAQHPHQNMTQKGNIIQKLLHVI